MNGAFDSRTTRSVHTGAGSAPASSGNSAAWARSKLLKKKPGVLLVKTTNWTWASSLSAATTSCSQETASGTITFAGSLENTILRIRGVGLSTLMVLGCIILCSLADADVFAR